ncbi:MAG: DUF2336 domain-containing protein [Acidibrevibacterium sp.]|uniref:DUF2336 domain-containing protein n=1 Tax=Acidibrevibacterium sp. TaxID=2606776 RepID=UPI003D00F0FB
MPAGITNAPGVPLGEASEAARVRSGASRTTAPAVLERLASDPSVTVRAAVALNPATPPAADEILAADTDERVRVLLARKLATSLPLIDAGDQARLCEQAYQTLMNLVADEAVRVRATIAEMIKELPNVPQALVLRLARDATSVVSVPILRFSPLLESEDLLALLADPPHSGTASTIARRAFVPAAVAEAIAASSDNQAIQILLENPRAQIREATLDALIARAKGEPRWHAPLVRRPALTAKAARALAEIVATDLLGELSRRADLPAEAIALLRQRLSVRLGVPEKPSAPNIPPDLEAALAWARARNAETRLDESLLLACVRSGDIVRCIAILAVAAEVPAALIERSRRLRHAKGLVSLVWKAGFSMQVAGLLQTLLCDLPPASLLSPKAGGGFPLTAEEMHWQIEFLEHIAV